MLGAGASEVKRGGLALGILPPPGLAKRFPQLWKLLWKSRELH